MKTILTLHPPLRAFAVTQLVAGIAGVAFGFAGRLQVIAAIEFVDPDPKTGTSKAVVVERSPLAHTAQFLPLSATDEIVGPTDPTQQADRVIDHLQAALREAQSTLDDVVKLNVVVAQTDAVVPVNAVIARRFSGRAKPAAGFVVGALAHPKALVGIDAVAVSKLRGIDEVRRLRAGPAASDAPSATLSILPAGAAVYVSGQAERGELPEATRKTMESLTATLSYLRLNRSHIVQLKAFMRPMSDVSLVKKEIARFFDGELVPPTAFVEWISSTPIEIELIAAAAAPPSGTAETVRYLTPPGVKASPVYSRIAWLDSPKIIYASGLYGARSESAEGQIRELFESLREILQKTGSDFQHLVKATYYVATDDASNKLNELRPNYYDPNRPPAASKAMVPGVGLRGKSVTLDMIAVPARR